MRLFKTGDAPLPKPKGFGVGIVDPENGYPGSNPKVEYTFQLNPERLPIFGFEVNWKDVLVLLGGFSAY